jgi:hypothetical protein
MFGGTYSSLYPHAKPPGTSAASSASPSGGSNPAVSPNPPPASTVGASSAASAAGRASNPPTPGLRPSYGPGSAADRSRGEFGSSLGCCSDREEPIADEKCRHISHRNPPVPAFGTGVCDSARSSSKSCAHSLPLCPTSSPPSSPPSRPCPHSGSTFQRRIHTEQFRGRSRFHYAIHDQHRRVICLSTAWDRCS